MMNSQRDWGELRRRIKYEYKICAFTFCALLVLLVCYKATINRAPRELVDATASGRHGTNITASGLHQVVSIERKALVVSARSQDEIQWMGNVQSDWAQYPYLVSEDTNPNSTLFVPENKGNEAMRYLSFIIDNYDTLPDIIAFRHGHENSWHQAFDSAAQVNNLNLTTVRSRRYQNFMCAGAVDLNGCNQHILLANKQRLENGSNGVANYPLSPRSEPKVDAAIYKNWDSWFGVPMPEDLTSACCAQFVVVKEAVWRWPKEKYAEWRQWLLDTELESLYSGMVFERLWHFLFGMPPVLCEPDDHCFCNVYIGPLTRDCPSS